MNLEQASGIAKNLIAELKLDDWEISMFEDSKMGVTGRIEYELPHKKAKLFLNFKRAEEVKDLYSPEGLVRHELLHIILCPIADLIMNMMKSILNETSKNLVEAAYNHAEEIVIEHLNRILGRQEQ
jgi:hypothetical protein